MNRAAFWRPGDADSDPLGNLPDRLLEVDTAVLKPGAGGPSGYPHCCDVRATLSFLLNLTCRDFRFEDGA